MGKPNPSDAARSNRIIRVVLTVMLAVSMIPATGVQSAFADEPAERPAVTGGDAALTGFGRNDASASAGTPVAAQREDGTLAADGLVYVATDGGLSLVGFDGPAEGEDAARDITVPESVSVDGKDTPVVAVAMAEGNVADSVVSLTLPQSINDVDVATFAAAFPNLAAIEIATPKASAPVAAGAAAMRAAYSSFGGVLYRNAWIAADGDASQTTLTKELVWAPPATVVARIPVECSSIAPGAFADAKGLKTVVCFGVMGEIPQAKKAESGTVVPGAFTDEQVATVNVIVPQTGTVVPDGDHVNASVAVTDHSTMDVKREAWWKSGFASDRITLGEVCGSTTNTLPVTEEGVLKAAEAEVAYAPETTQNSSSRKAGIEPPESAIPTPVPDEDELDSSESGLVFTHLADMTLSVSWKGDPTATPAHIDIPAYATINGVTYPVTEIASEAFKGAVFLTSITIPETVKVIGNSAFEGCTNLAEPEFPSTLRGTVDMTTVEDSVLLSTSGGNGTDYPTPSRRLVGEQGEPSFVESVPEAASAEIGSDDSISPYTLSASQIRILIAFPSYLATKDTTVNGEGMNSDTSTLSGLRWFSNKVVYTYISEYDMWNINVPPYMFEQSPTETTIAFDYREPATSGHVLYFKIANTNADYRITGTDFTWTYGLRQDDYFGLMYLQESNKDASSDTITMICNLNATYVGDLARRPYDETRSVDLNDYPLKSEAGHKWSPKRDEEGNIIGWEEVGAFTLKSDFGSISYDLDEGEEADPLPTFYVSGAEKLPTVPEPRRDGYEFQGWTWDGQTSPVKDPTAAFSGGGAVTLTAHWEVVEPETPEATHFFTGERPLRFDDASERQTHVIKVRLSNTPRTLASVLFEGDDRTHLLKDTSGVELYVGAGEDAIASGTRLPWGGSTGSGWTCELAKLSDDSYGVYVGISVPTTAIDEASVPVSYTDGSYVASLVKMNYVFA